MTTQNKLFAFRLANRQSKGADMNNRAWKARDGIVSAQICTCADMLCRLPGAIEGHDTSILC